MTNPYANLDNSKFWKKAVADVSPADIHPRSAKRFSLSGSDLVATAGSCFAQNVAKYLRSSGAVKVLEAEELRPEDPVFSGRFGNIYTARQLLQLIDEVQSGSPNADCAVQRREDGRWVDLFRPFMEPDGFETAEDVVNARAEHIRSLAPMLSEPNVFVFTLGLTEGWEDARSGLVYPICPGVYSDDDRVQYRFHNFSYEEILEDMTAVVTRMTQLNQKVKVMLTVSPVPLTATYADDDVLTATTLSKSILRTVCDTLSKANENVFYFPSFEMIANPYTAESAYADNLRSVRPDAVEAVMKRFEADYLISGQGAADQTGIDEDVICDDVEIENSMGF